MQSLAYLNSSSSQFYVNRAAADCAITPLISGIRLADGGNGNNDCYKHNNSNNSSSNHHPYHHHYPHRQSNFPGGSNLGGVTIFEGQATAGAVQADEAGERGDRGRPEWGGDGRGGGGEDERRMRDGMRDGRKDEARGWWHNSFQREDVEVKTNSPGVMFFPCDYPRIASPRSININGGNNAESAEYKNESSPSSSSSPTLQSGSGIIHVGNGVAVGEREAGARGGGGGMGARDGRGGVSWVGGREGGTGGGAGRNRKCKDEKICAVCGDKALGFNFDALSCESCKAFFRRNAPKGLSYFKCPYDERCTMDLSNRRFCKHCRLKKCFKVGMRKEYILSDEEKALKRLKIEENRYVKKGGNAPHGYSSSPRSNAPHTSSSPHRAAAPETQALQTTPPLINISEGVDDFRGQRISPDDSPGYIEDEGFNSMSTPLTEDSSSYHFPDISSPLAEDNPSYRPPHIPLVRDSLDYSMGYTPPHPFNSSSPTSSHPISPSPSYFTTPITAAFQPAHNTIPSYTVITTPSRSPPSLPSAPSPSRSALCAEDMATILDLHSAYRNSLEVSISDKPDVSRDRANFSDLVNIAELSVRRVIAMAKQVPAFRALPQVEQIHLLKGGSIELLILRSVITFDVEKQHFLDPVDSEETKAMKLEQLEQAESGTGLFEEHMKFVRSLASDLGADDTMLILLLVISLFSPDRDNLEFKELVAAEQEKYSTLLKNYLDATCSTPSLSQSLFPRLLLKLTDIRNLNEEHSQVLLKINPESIQPLMKEVLDLQINN